MIVESPVRSIVKAPIPFDVLSLSGLKAWYDASDPDSITLDVGVTQWNDKGGEENHLTQITGGQQPAYSPTNKSVTFDGVDDELTATSAITDSVINIFTVRKSSDTQSISYYNGASNFTYAALDGSVATGLTSNFGSPSLYKNGTLQSPSTRDDLHTILNDGTLHVESYIGGDMSA